MVSMRGSLTWISVNTVTMTHPHSIQSWLRWTLRYPISITVWLSATVIPYLSSNLWIVRWHRTRLEQSMVRVPWQDRHGILNLNPLSTNISSGKSRGWRALQWHWVGINSETWCHSINYGVPPCYLRYSWSRIKHSGRNCSIGRILLCLRNTWSMSFSKSGLEDSHRKGVHINSYMDTLTHS